MKLTQKEAAEMIGVNDYQLGNYETNRSQPSLEVLKKMSKVYNVSIDRMLGNNVLKNNLPSTEEEQVYMDQSDLLNKLNDIVEKLKEANKK